MQMLHSLTLQNVRKYQPPRLAAVDNLCAHMKALAQERAARALRTRVHRAELTNSVQVLLAQGFRRNRCTCERQVPTTSEVGRGADIKQEVFLNTCWSFKIQWHFFM